MTIVTKRASFAALIVLICLVPATARAQAQRFRASITPAVATTSGDAEFALGGTFGYSFSEHFSFDGDFTWIDAAAGGFRSREFNFQGRDGIGGLDDFLSRPVGMFGRRGMRLATFPNLPNLPDNIGAIRGATDGRTLIGTIGMRYELPVSSGRLRPYVSGGLGINNTNQELRIEPFAAVPQFDGSVSRTGMAFSGGVGASVRLFSQLSADVDAKYFRLSGDRNLMRLGGGISVRF
jgi:opacity protein-like surface antigen